MTQNRNDIEYERAQRRHILMIPGPKHTLTQLGVYGHLVDFFRRPITTMQDYQQQFGRLSGVLAPVKDGEKGFIFAFGADYNREVFSNPSQFHSSAMLNINDSSVRNLANGLTFMNGSEHITKRRIIMPAFHRKYIEYYRDDMVAITDDMLNTWHLGDTVDMNHACHELTAKIAIKTLFGLDSEHEGREMSALIARWMTLATSPLLRIIPLDLPFSPVRQIRHISHDLERYMLDLIARKRNTKTQATDVLATLMQAVDEDGNSLSDDELIGQVNVLFLAGHETSGNALTWTLFLLSQHADILRDVLDELDGVLGGDAPSLEQLGQLPFLEAIIKESMRVLPPVVWIQRIANEGACLGNHRIGKGSNVILSHYMTHHDPDLYSNSHAFDPYRWQTIKPASYEYMAFSAGPRRCIGAEFAMMEMKICLAMILQRYQLELLPNTQIDRHVTVTLSTKKALPMRVKPPQQALSVNRPTGDIHELVTL
ncbi:MAG: cytochrome P450 [Phototrophicaceae bacterium]